MMFRPKAMGITHQEIADRAGVSRALVTRALHRTHGARVSADTRNQIIQVARELGYQPRNVTTHNIGYVGRVDGLYLVGDNRFVFFVDRALRDSGFRMVLTSLSDKHNPEGEVSEVVNPKTVDGVIFNRWFGGRIHNLLSPKIPWLVLSDEDAIPRHVDKVTMDSVLTAERVARHFLEYGHQRICILSNPSVGNVTTHLHIGVRNVLAAAGLPQIVSSIEVVHDIEIAMQLKAVMKQSKAPTAFLVFGAEKSLTALNLLNYFGYRVPQDVSLVSLMDSNILEPVLPAVTATTAMGFDVAERAVARLLEKIEDPSSRPQHIVIPGELVHRQSVGVAKSRVKFRR
jgi:DNA-binding LacI/PurR family transcriptional regulator